MKQELEQLSAAVDGEHEDAGILGDIASNETHQQTWKRYHLIRDLMREEVSNEGFVDVTEQVARAIQQQPAILAPARKRHWLPGLANVVPLVRQSGQYAIAASVAVAVILGYQQFNQPSPEVPFSPASVPVIPGLQGGLSPVSLEQTRSLPRADVQQQRRRFNAYLDDHRQQVRMKSSAPRKVDETPEQGRQQSSKKAQ